MSKKLDIITTRYKFPISKAGKVENQLFQNGQGELFRLANDPNTEFMINTKLSPFSGSPYVTLRLNKAGTAEKKIMCVKIWFEYENQKLFETSALNYTFSRTYSELKFAITSQNFYCLKGVENDNKSINLVCELKDLNIIQNPYANCKIRQRFWSDYCENIGDVTIKNAETEFKVSSCILSIQSEMFDRMLKSSLKEGQSKVIEINDVSSELLEAFIRWMYLGKIVKPALAENLFLLGDRYMVEELKNDCVGYIAQNLTSENVSKCYSMAIKYNCKLLSDCVALFVKEDDPSNKLDKFFGDVWNQLAFGDNK